jgi:glycosyltransferase involved in cell wall biosynthesis
MEVLGMKPRLLVFSKFFWPEGSGAELATYLFIRRYLADQFDVVIVSGTDKPIIDRGCCRYVVWDVLRAGFKPAEWLLFAAKLRDAAKLIRWADIVYIPSHTLLPLAPIVKQVNPRVKVVLHVHNNQLLTYTSIVISDVGLGIRSDLLVELYENRSLLRALVSGSLSISQVLYRLALLYSDAVIFMVRRQLELIRKYGVRLPLRRAEVIYNPPPFMEVRKALGEAPVFIYVGGESFIKGFHVLLKALPSLVRLGARVRLFGSYRDFQVRNRYVELVGRVPHGVVMRAHEDAWGLLFPSINEEPLPYAVVEAALAGTVPIAARVGGVPEILSGTGAERFMFKAGDAENLVGRVEELIGLGVEGVMEVGEEVKGVVRRRLEESASRLPEVFMEILSSD